MSQHSDDTAPNSSLLESVLPLVARLGTVAAALIVFVGGLLYVKQESLLYFPEIGGIPKRPQDNPRGYRSPEERNIPYEDCRITSSIDKVVIQAWLLKYTLNGHDIPSNTPTIIFFHGNAGNIGLRLPNAMQMVQYLRANVLLVEYRGYGDSDNVPPNEVGLQRDAIAALDFVRNHPQLDSNKIFLFGRSLGGAVAVQLAKYAQEQHIPLAGLMLENTFLSIGDMVDHLLPYLGLFKTLVLRMQWKSKSVVPTLQVPILYLAGSSDTLVPHSHMLQLYNTSTRSRLCQIHIVKGGTHNETWLQGGKAYWEKMKAFMDQALAGITNGHEASSSSGNAATVSSIPTMSHRFVDIAREAVSGKGIPEPDKKEL